MQIEKLKILYESDALRDAYIIPQQDDAWIVEVTRRAADPIILTTHRYNAVRRFKSLDAAFNAIQEVGFDRANIRRQLP